MNTYKQGERVRTVKVLTSPGMVIPTGTLGTVVEAYTAAGDWNLVVLDGHDEHGTLCVSPEDLEPAGPTTEERTVAALERVADAMNLIAERFTEMMTALGPVLSQTLAVMESVAEEEEALCAYNHSLIGDMAPYCVRPLGHDGSHSDGVLVWT